MMKKGNLPNVASKYYSSLLRSKISVDRKNLPHFRGRVALLREVAKKPGFEWLNYTSRQQFECNSMMLGRLIGSVLDFFTPELVINLAQETSWFDLGLRELVNTEEDCLRSLIYESFKQGSGLESLIKLKDLAPQLDSFSHRYFYLCTGSTQFPIRVMAMKDLVIVARVPTQEIMWNMLLLLTVTLIPYFAITESVELPVMASLEQKTQVVGAVLGMALEVHFDISKPYSSYIIEDCYNNIIRLSSICPDRDNDEHVKMVQDLIPNLRDHLEHALSRGYYTQVNSPWEIEAYNHLMEEYVKAFDRVVTQINFPNNKRELPYGLKDYYLEPFDQKEHNNLKVDEDRYRMIVQGFYKYHSFIGVNDDIYIGLFHLMVHLRLSNMEDMYVKGSPLFKLVSHIVSPYFKVRPLAVKSILKASQETLLRELKEQGLIQFHQMETIFGFRNSHLILKEVKDDYMNWVNGDQAKFSQKQADLIYRYSSSFYNYITFDGRDVGSIIAKNLSKYNSFEDLVGPAYIVTSSKGAVDDVKVPIEDGKPRGISKQAYFSLFQDPILYKRTKPRRNKVLIKYEEYIKQRIVINSTLDTFIPLSKLNAFVSRLTQGVNIPYFSSTKEQKAGVYARFQKYLMYNRHVGKRYLCMPLDYSSYDHTITMGFIVAAVRSLARRTPYIHEVDALLDDFISMLSKEVIYFDKLKGDPDNNAKYKFGMLSGWKITSSVESLGNAITSMAIMNILGESLIDILTMGDDLVLVVDKWNLSNEEIRAFLEKVCVEFEKYGFKMNPPKNSAGYFFIEFLRITYFPSMVVGYPMRALNSLDVLKPGREDQTFGITELQSVIKKICKRYGLVSNYLELAKFIMPLYKKKDIKQYGVSFTKEPFRFKLLHRRVNEYTYKYNVNTAPIYLRYLRLLGRDNSLILMDYIRREIATVNHQVTRIIPIVAFPPKGISPGVARWISITSIEFPRFLRKEINTSKKFSMPDYHLCMLILEISSKLKYSLDETLKFTRTVMSRMVQSGYLSQRQYANNNICLSEVQTRKDLLWLFKGEKILLEEFSSPSMILSFIKRKFLEFCYFKLQIVKDQKFRQLILRTIRKNKNFYSMRAFGYLLGHTSDQQLPGYKNLIAFRCD